MTPENVIRDLYCAIGRVASESANTEQILRVALREYTGFGEAVGVVFEGQSFDWLADSIRAIFKCALEALLEGSPGYESAKEKLEIIGNALTNTRQFRDRRNFIIHGTWTVCGPGVDCLVEPLAVEADGVIVFHFSRSRIRRYFESEAHLTVLEIERLADSISRQNDTLSHILRANKPLMYF